MNNSRFNIDIDPYPEPPMKCGILGVSIHINSLLDGAGFPPHNIEWIRKWFMEDNMYYFDLDNIECLVDKSKMEYLSPDRLKSLLTLHKFMLDMGITIVYGLEVPLNCDDTNKI